MSLKRWVIRRTELKSIDIAEKHGLNPILADILCVRGLSDDQIREYIDEGGIESPFALKDMTEAVDRIQSAISKQEKIIVFGDYDCDGITSTVLLVTYLQAMGADVRYKVPEREEGGYGLNNNAIEQIEQEGAQLIITVDNGITAVEEAEYITELGMDLVITDHHSPSDILPKAVAVVNPHRKDCPSSFKDLAGVGVVFKLIAALEDGDYNNAIQFAGDLTAIGTIGDVMPLVGENRTIVRHGLELLKFSENIGLNALLDAAKINRDRLNAVSTAFSIVPRINASGRFSMANKAVELLMCDDEQEASETAQKINSLNAKRQALEQDILKDIYEEIGKNHHKLYNRVLVFAKEGWPHGILGIAAAKLTERFGKPTVLMSIRDGQAVGSARSVENFSIYDALHANEGLLSKWGGHSLAAGMSLDVKDIPLLELGLNEYAAKETPRMPQTCIYIDRQISAEEINLETVETFSLLEPCGQSNPTPVFMIRKLLLEQIIPLAGGAHLKLKLNQNGKVLYGLLFGVEQGQLYYTTGEELDILVTLDINHYNGNSSVSLIIKDLRPHSFEQNKYFNAKLAYEKAMLGGITDSGVLEKLIPSREDFAAIYQYLKKAGIFHGTTENLYLAMNTPAINYGKFAVAVEVLNEHGLIECSHSKNRISLCETFGKVDIFNSEILHSLKQG